MAPIEPTATKTNTLPLIVIASVVTAAAGGLFSILRSFVALRRVLPISSRIRDREKQRRNHVILFGSLAALCLIVNVFNIAEAVLDSYHRFAVENSIIPHIDIWSSPLWFPQQASGNQMQLRAWYDSSPLKSMAHEVIASPRDFWWIQQRQAAILIWSVFLMTEARRRNLPRAWVYLPLALSIGLSVPVNLLFVALLLTPTPFKSQQKTSRRSSSSGRRPISRYLKKLQVDYPATWAIHPFVPLSIVTTGLLGSLVGPYVLAPGSILAAVQASEICLFAIVLLLQARLLPLWVGTSYPTVHSAHASNRWTFRIASLLAFAVHASSTYTAITANAPPLSHSRFRLIEDDMDDFADSTSASYFTAIGRILGSLSDSPLVQIIGWDVMLTGLSIIVWAGVRGLHPSNILSSVGMPIKAELPHISNASITGKAKATKQSAERAVDKAEAKAKRAAADAENTIRKATGQDDVADREDTPPITRSADRAARKISASPSSKTASKTGGSRRGRPGKAEQSLEKATRPREVDNDDEDEDPDYEPTAANADELVEHDEHLENVDMSEEAESAAVAWGTLVLGGLGVGMAGVVGAELL